MFSIFWSLRDLLTLTENSNLKSEIPNPKFEIS